jgi:benzoate membrane transport protein
MVADESHRDASIITFLATASGMNFLGMSSVFWGLVIACLAYIILYKSWSIEKNSLRGQNERRI